MAVSIEVAVSELGQGLAGVWAPARGSSSSSEGAGGGENAGSGVDEIRVRVEGYADTVPLLEEELEGLTEAQRLARHRRVIVRIY